MSSYVTQKVAEKRKRLEKLEEQLFDVSRQVDLLTAELAAYEDVLANDDNDEAEIKKPTVKAKIKAKPRPAPPPPQHRQETDQQSGHWAGLLKKYARTGRFTLDDVSRDLAAMGQPNARKSVRAKMAKLVNRGTLKRLADGVFSVVSEPRGISGVELRAAGIIPPQARLIGED